MPTGGRWWSPARCTAQAVVRAAAGAGRTPTWCWSRSRRTRRPPSAWPRRSCTAAIRAIIMGSFAADQVITPVEISSRRCARPCTPRPTATSSRSGSPRPHPPPGSVTSAPPGHCRCRGAPNAHAVAEFVEKPDERGGARLSGDGGVLVERGHVRGAGGRAAQAPGNQRAGTLCRADGDRRGLGHPGARRGDAPGLARPAQDSHRLRGGRACGGRRRRGDDPGIFTWDDVATSPPSGG